MFKKIGGLLATLLGLALLVYSAARSLDFIAMTLPGDRQALAYFGLAALDGGLLAWLLSYLYGSRGGWQRGISLLMVVVDFIGCVSMFTLDTVYRTGESGLTSQLPQEAIQVAVLGLSGIIALNIAATIGHHLTDPDALKAQAEEEAQGMIHDAALAQIREQSTILANQIAPAVAAAWSDQTKARFRLQIRDIRSQTENLLPGGAPVLAAPETSTGARAINVPEAQNPTLPHPGESS